MREIRTSALMSGDGNRDDEYSSAPVPVLDSTDFVRQKNKDALKGG